MKSNQNLKLAIVITAAFWMGLGSVIGHAGTPVSRARAAELALHRIENLVILKKIQATHLSRLRSLTLSTLARTTEEEPAYLAVASQYPAGDGTQSSVGIPLKTDGKALKQNETLGSEPVQAPVWPTLDAVTLAETSLHCLQGEKIDNQRPDLCTHPQIAAFGADFSSLVLSQESGQNGPIAIIDVRITQSRTILRIRLKSDGVPTEETPILFLQE